MGDADTAIWAMCMMSFMITMSQAVSVRSGLRTTHHKTARTVSLKATLLPIILPGLSVLGTPWVNEAKAALEKIGLVFKGLLDGPIFQPPSKWGLCQRGISSAEVTRFLRLCFESGSPPSAAESRVSSHSLKATMLSWGGKYGLGPSDQAGAWTACQCIS